MEMYEFEGKYLPIEKIPVSRLRELFITMRSSSRLIQEERDYLRSLLLAGANATENVADKYKRGY